MANNMNGHNNNGKVKLNIYEKGEDRSQRKKSQSKEPVFHKNKVINHFAECIHAMNEAVLVPSKLRDIDVDNSLFDLSTKTDLLQYFQMLNTVREDLFNGYAFTEEAFDQNNNRKCDRQLSLEAFNSLSNFPILRNQTFISIVNSDGDHDSLEQFDEKVYQITGALMDHLQSLYAILKQFSKAAQYITKRYQQEVDASNN